MLSFYWILSLSIIFMVKLIFIYFLLYNKMKKLIQLSGIHKKSTYYFFTFQKYLFGLSCSNSVGNNLLFNLITNWN